MAASPAAFWKCNACRCTPGVGLDTLLRDIFSNNIANRAEWPCLVRRARNLDSFVVLRVASNDPSVRARARAARRMPEV
jgi:hypothetical protein